MSSSQSFPQKVKSLFVENLTLKVISILVAAVLWILVLGSRQVEIVKELSLEMVPPQNLVLVSDLPEKIAFKLSGPKAFLRTINDRRESPIKINLAGYRSGYQTIKIMADQLRLPAGVKIVSITPSTVSFKLELLKRKVIPVRVDTKGIIAKGFSIRKINVKPPLVTLRGAETKLEDMTEVLSLPIDLSGVKRSFEQPVLLDLPPQGVILESEAPVAHVEVVPVEARLRRMK